MAKVYAIISGKGGVGKTTSTINLGVALNKLGKNILMIDGNLSTPNMGLHLGTPIVPITINHILDGQARLEDAIYEHESGTKIILASLSVKECEKISYKRFLDITKKLRKIADHILIDSAAGLGKETKSIMAISDEMIIITNPEMAAVTDALKTIKLAEEMNKPIKGVIITKYTGDKTDMPLTNIKEMLEIPILGIIPKEDSIRESQSIKNSVILTHPKSWATKTYLNTSKRLLGEDIRFKMKRKGGILSIFLRKMRSK